MPPRRRPGTPADTPSARDTWQFRARFRRGAFGWKSAPAIARLREAVAEIAMVARYEPVRAAEGAVILIEKLSPALEQVDGSSGAMGEEVYHALATLVPIIGTADVTPAVRHRWLERLYAALEADEMPWIESLGNFWGALCGDAAIASAWADDLLPLTRLILDPARQGGAHFKGTIPCLSALLRAGRHTELIALAGAARHWHDVRWAAMALRAEGRWADAVAMADGCRSPWSSDVAIDRFCEDVLLEAGQRDDAYRGYGLRTHTTTSHLATFRALAKRYPERARAEVLRDLVAASPGQEGKWFAAAKDAGLRDEALALARQSAVDPRTLTRAARDFVRKDPAFALQAGLLALHWLGQGAGYEVTSLDVVEAFRHTMAAATACGHEDAGVPLIDEVVRQDGPRAAWVRTCLGRANP